jgi:hypothetical protein
MPKRKEILLDKVRPYHIVSKAIEGKQVFAHEEDRARFIYQMYAANVGSPVPNIYRYDIVEVAQLLLQGKEGVERFIKQEHAPFVHIFSFVLAQDHYHFGLVPTKPEYVSPYMQKLNLGFAKYFNSKHTRAGSLFESRFKVAPIQSPKELNEVVRYINIKNLLDVHQPAWEAAGLKNIQDAVQFVESYAYSSFPDLFGERASHLLSERSITTLKNFLGEDFFLKKEATAEMFDYYVKDKSKLHSSLYLE